MENWQYICLVLCTFGFFKEFRPSEPFVTEYLMEYKNFTIDTIVKTAYPISTYTYLATLPVIFLITDFLRYKSIIVAEGIAFVLTYTLLIWGNGLTNLKIVEVLYGVACSTEVSYYTYIYAKVDKEHYKKVTSYTHAAIIIGNFAAAVASQLLVSYSLMSYHQLNYITLAAMCTAFAISLVLPGVKKSMYFYRNIEISLDNDGKPDNESACRISSTHLSYGERVKKAYAMLWSDFKKAYTDMYIIKWSLWWTIASAGFSQVVIYIQPLYETVYSYEKGTIYNAAVDAVHTVLSAIMTIAMGYIYLPWNKWGESLLFCASMLQGILLLIMSQSTTIISVYTCYIICRTSYQVMMAVASAEIAQNISDDSYGLIFGLNRFVSLVIQSIITVAIIDDGGFALSERHQFLVYGIYFCSLGIIFGIAALASIRKYSTSTGTLDIADANVSNNVDE